MSQAEPGLALPDEQVVLISGKWERAAGKALRVINPSTGRSMAAVGSADGGQVQRAVEAAQAARRGYARFTAAERADVVRTIADVLRANVDVLAPIIAAEVGKPMREARMEVASAAAYADYMAAWALRIEGEVLPADASDEILLLQREPIGVVVAITAWNFPLDLMLRKLAPALVAGNCVIVKPTEVTPLSAIMAMKLIIEALTGIDPGVLGLLPGGRETGQKLVANAGINMISMTGHRNSGKAIMAAAAENLTRVALELGGLAPVIVCADADLDRAVAALVEARFMNAGQVCTSAERILVSREVHDAFTERFIAAVEELTVGHPESDPDMGPLVSEAQFRKVSASVERAESEGARRLLTSPTPSGSGGFWFPPTVLGNARPEMAIMRDETFGPVASIMEVDGLNEALTVANDTPYGLTAFLFSNDYKACMRAARELEFGEIFINRTMGEALQGFHTGHKQSGIGGEDGKHGLMKYTQIKSVYHHFG
jgi:lactaldehyde dehydrogenase / glycolaldehyde dehydrogenase